LIGSAFPRVAGRRVDGLVRRVLIVPDPEAGFARNPNPKSESRNPKEARRGNDHFGTRTGTLVILLILLLSAFRPPFEFPSDFVLRISNLKMHAFA
jgi:hypothetical protein